MNLPVIQSLWVCSPGERVSNLELLTIHSFCANGHDFHLYCYYDIPNLPKETPGDGRLVVKDANEILPESEIFVNEEGSYAHFADWFRYAMLVKHGGFWVDMDVACIKPFDFDTDIVLAGGDDGFTNAVVGMPANHPLMVALEQTCRNYKKKEKVGWGKMGGPEVLTRFIQQFGMEQYVKPFMYFRPWGFRSWPVALDRTFSDGVDLHPNTFAIHFFNSMIKRAGLDKNAQFDPSSLIEQLKAKYGVEPVKNADTITASDLSASIRGNLARKQARKRARKKLVRWLIIGIIAILMVASYLVGRLHK